MIRHQDPIEVFGCGGVLAMYIPPAFRVEDIEEIH